MDKRFARLLAVSLFCTVAALAQPVINVAFSTAVARGPGLPGSGIAQGSIFGIYGTGLGPNAGVAAAGFPLPTTLGGASGTSVAVTVGGTQVSAIMLYAGANQINAILSSTTPVGTGTLTVTYNGQVSAPAAIQVVASTFGIYTFSEQGNGQAIATDLSYNVNTIIHTFHPGDYATLWGTGLGAINASDAEPAPFGNVGSVTVYVGNAAASKVTYYGRSPNFAGLDQIDFQIPQGVTGCYVPVAVQTGGVPGNIGNFTTIAVSDSGSTCSDSVMGQDLVNDLAAGQTVDFGYIRLESWVAQYISGSAGTGSSDYGFATFSEYTPSSAGLAEYGVSSGYCEAVDCSVYCGTVLGYTTNLADDSPAQLDAGAALSVENSPVVSMTQLQTGAGIYYGYLSNAGRYLFSDFTYPVAGNGGTAVGGFTATDITGGATAFLTGINNAQTVPLSADLSLQWTGGDPTLQNGQITIYAQSLNQTGPNSQFAFVQCTAPLSAGKFTIPGWVLAALPPSGTGGTVPFTYPEGWIQVGQYNKPATFSAPGLTKGIITDIFYNGKGVYFK
jgi:uncharacterized protein (TIGR03437 family)